MNLSSMSLNKKFAIAILVCFFGTSVLFLGVFSNFFTAQVKNEKLHTRKRTEQLLEFSMENVEVKQFINRLLQARLKDVLKENFEENKIFEMKEKAKDIILSKAENSQKDKTILENEIDNIFYYDEFLKKVARKQGLENPSVTLIDYTDVEIRYQGMLRGLRLIAMGGVVVILVVLILWFLMHKYVLLPVDNLVEASQALAKGDLSARIEIGDDFSRKDELDILAVSFNEMAENLQNSLDEIAKREKLLQSLIDAIPDGIRVIDDRFNVLMANQSYSKYVGHNIDDLVCSKCYETSHKREKPCPSTLITCPMDLLKNSDNPVKVVQKFINSEDEENYVEISAAPMITDFGGQEQRLIVESIRDLTNDIRFSHQQKLSSVGMLATSIAHEMRNPLGSIRMILEGLLKRYEKGQENEAETKKYMKLIVEQITTCIDVTERLLKMARNNSEKREKVDVVMAIKETVALLDYEAKKNGIVVELELVDEEKFIMATESEIRMALVNLIQNAFHAIDKSNGRVSIKLEEKQDDICIEIKDNGLGMDSEKIGRIFEPFFTKREGKTKGTGLGLTITKSIIDKFGGKIDVESEKGEGTTFNILFKTIKEV